MNRQQYESELVREVTKLFSRPRSDLEAARIAQAQLRQALETMRDAIEAVNACGLDLSVSRWHRAAVPGPESYLKTIITGLIGCIGLIALMPVLMAVVEMMK